MEIYVKLDEALEEILSYLDCNDILLVEKDLIGDVELPTKDIDDLKEEIIDSLKEKS